MELKKNQWISTNAPQASVRTDDIWFINPLVGWAVNDLGQILKTNDGGQSWQVQFHSSDILFRCVGFATPMKGWAGGFLKTSRTLKLALYFTEDGGKKWEKAKNIPQAAPQASCGLSVVNESVVYVSGTNVPGFPPRMMKTVDGGATWIEWEMSEYATILVDTYFVDPNHGWVIGGKANNLISNPQRKDLIPIILYTENGGKSWVNQIESIESSFSPGEWGWKIFYLGQFIAVSVETIVGKRGAIIKTLDGGDSWEKLPITNLPDNPRFRNVEGVGFIDENNGWVGAQAIASRTKDGGKTWEDDIPFGNYINRFRFLGNPVTVGYASGKTIYKYLPIDSIEANDVSDKNLSILEPRSTSFFIPIELQECEKLASIEYTLSENASEVILDIWDWFGPHVCTLVSERNVCPGTKTVIWNGTNEQGEDVLSGLFVCRITVDGNTESQIIYLDKQIEGESNNEFNLQ